MPKAGEGRSIRIAPDVYAELLKRKHGMMTVSDVIAGLIKEQQEPIVEVINNGANN